MPCQYNFQFGTSICSLLGCDQIFWQAFFVLKRSLSKQGISPVVIARPQHVAVAISILRTYRDCFAQFILSIVEGLAMTTNTILCTRQAYVVPEKLATPICSFILMSKGMLSIAGEGIIIFFGRTITNPGLD